MRVSKDKAAENREALLAAASRLFRLRGIDGVGVADIAAEAGLTHGALYAHFKSKDELAAAALAYGFEGNMKHSRERGGDRSRTFAEHVKGFLSIRMRDNVETGCPMAASASEASRHGKGVSACYTNAVNEMVSTLERSLDETIPASQRRRLAIATVAAEIGAIAMSRAIAKTDPAFSDEVLEAVQDTLKAAHEMKRSGRTTPLTRQRRTNQRRGAD